MVVEAEAKCGVKWHQEPRIERKVVSEFREKIGMASVHEVLNALIYGFSKILSNSPTQAV